MRLNPNALYLFQQLLSSSTFFLYSLLTQLWTYVSKSPSSYDSVFAKVMIIFICCNRQAIAVDIKKKSYKTCESALEMRFCWTFAWCLEAGGERVWAGVGSGVFSRVKEMYGKCVRACVSVFVRVCVVCLCVFVSAGWGSRASEAWDGWRMLVVCLLLLLASGGFTVPHHRVLSVCLLATCHVLNHSAADGASVKLFSQVVIHYSPNVEAASI